MSMKIKKEKKSTQKKHKRRKVKTNCAYTLLDKYKGAEE